MNILAIDPGKRTGYYNEKGIGSCYGVMDGDDVVECGTLISGWTFPFVIVVEDQFRCRMTRQQEKTFHRRRYTWDILGSLYGIKVFDVLPNVWQSAFGLIERTKKGDDKITAREKKKRIVMAARLRSGLPLDMDEADAYFIHEYAVKYMDLEG